jgi:hypothetical protein
MLAESEGEKIEFTEQNTKTGTAKNAQPLSGILTFQTITSSGTRYRPLSISGLVRLSDGISRALSIAGFQDLSRMQN